MEQPAQVPGFPLVSGSGKRGASCLTGAKSIVFGRSDGGTAACPPPALAAVLSSNRPTETFSHQNIDLTRAAMRELDSAPPGPRSCRSSRSAASRRRRRQFLYAIVTYANRGDTTQRDLTSLHQTVVSRFDTVSEQFRSARRDIADLPDVCADSHGSAAAWNRPATAPRLKARGSNRFSR